MLPKKFLSKPYAHCRKCNGNGVHRPYRINSALCLSCKKCPQCDFYRKKHLDQKNARSLRMKAKASMYIAQEMHKANELQQKMIELKMLELELEKLRLGNK